MGCRVGVLAARRPATAADGRALFWKVTLTTPRTRNANADTGIYTLASLLVRPAEEVALLEQ